MQRVHERPTVILDGCHNPGAAIRLAETLRLEPPARPLVLVHGSRADKDVATVLQTLVPCVDAVVETGIPGLAAPYVLAPLAAAGGDGKVPVEVVPDLGQAVARAMAMAGPGGTVLITGSLYLVGAALASEPWA
jgi:dihydrofolate synthase/folylpolyglutamate synthase